MRRGGSRAGVLLACAVVGCAGAQVMAERDERARVEIGSMDAAVGSTWGAVETVDGRNCRTLAPGRRGVVPIPCWWGDGFRPAAGGAYRAEIVFKDSATEPARVELLAGLPEWYEAHRIGGAGDGGWTTAVVPVPWDMISRRAGTDRTEIAIIAPAGTALAVERVTIVAGSPVDDEARWANETRRWVDRAQAAKRVAAESPAAEVAVVPASMASSPIVAFARPTSRLVYRHSAPLAGEAGTPVRVTMATNEVEPAQLGVYANGTDLAGVSVELAPGGIAAADGTLLAATIEILAAEYSVVRSGKLFPQRLWPSFAPDVPAGRSQLFWVEVTTAAGATRAGTYRGELVVTARGVVPVRVAIEVEVLPIELLTMAGAKLHMGSCTVGLLPAHEIAFLARHNHNSINLWYHSAAPRIVKGPGAEFTLDFAALDDFMVRARAAGIENVVYFLGGDPYGFPDTLALERELYRQVVYAGTDLMAGRLEYLRKTGAAPGAILRELRPVYVRWVKLVMEHARDAGWPEIILTPFDEPAKWTQGNWAAAKHYYYRDAATGAERLWRPRVRELDAFLRDRRAEGIEPEFVCDGGAGEWIKGHFKDSCAAIHEAAPDARVYGSIHHAAQGLPFLPDVEVFCTNAIHEDATLGDTVRAAGPSKTFWQYSGTGDDTEPAGARYTFGFFFGAFDSRGSLCWAYNWGARFDTSAGDQWLYAWTTPYALVRAPFFEGVREAWDDRRYVETLRAVAAAHGRSAEAAALLDEVFNKAVTTRSEGGRDTVNDFWARTKDPDALDTMRRRIADAIVTMGR